MAGPVAAQEKYTTEIVLQRFRGELTLLDGRGDGARASEGGSDFGRASPDARCGGGGARRSGGAPAGGGGGGSRPTPRNSTTRSRSSRPRAPG